MPQPARPPFAWRADPSVPRFDDRAPVAVMDGTCALCSTGARLIARLDRREEVRICPAATPLGRALLRHHGLDPDDPESWLWIEDGVAWTGFDGMARAGARLGGAGRLLAPLRLLPPPLRDALYRRLARSRYRLFGRADLCAIPDPRMRARLIG